MQAFLCEIEYYDEMKNEDVREQYIIYDNTFAEATDQIVSYIGQEYIEYIVLTPYGSEDELVNISREEYCRLGGR